LPNYSNLIFILVLLIFSFAGFCGVKGMEGVIIKPNHSIILGRVEKVKKDFPYVTLTVKVIRSFVGENYVNFIKASQTLEIQPDYTEKEFKPSSFFKEERNLNNLQAYYFLPGDYFFAEVSLSGEERERKILYLNIQRVNEESMLKTVEPPDEFLKSCCLPSPSKLPPKPPPEYAKLASVLYGLIKSLDRSDFARRYQLYLSQDKVRVIIELLPGFKEIEGDYGVVMEGRTNSLIKALVPVDHLGLLAKDPSVGFIRPPHKPIPLSHSPTGPTGDNHSRITKEGE
jgi:hypothetical protein